VYEPAEALERRIDDLRADVRCTVTAGNGERARTPRAELRRIEKEWDAAIADLVLAGRSSARVSGRAAEEHQPYVIMVTALDTA
jgi:hypothetical protein